MSCINHTIDAVTWLGICSAAKLIGDCLVGIGVQHSRRCGVNKRFPHRATINLIGQVVIPNITRQCNRLTIQRVLDFVRNALDASRIILAAVNQLDDDKCQTIHLSATCRPTQARVNIHATHHTARKCRAICASNHTRFCGCVKVHEQIAINLCVHIAGTVCQAHHASLIGTIKRHFAVAPIHVSAIKRKLTVGADVRNRHDIVQSLIVCSHDGINKLASRVGSAIHNRNAVS